MVDFAKINFECYNFDSKSIGFNNYDLWKTNLYIVFGFERIKFITTTPKLKELPANASEKTKKQFADWQLANTIAQCYTLTSVAEHLHKQIDDLECVSEIVHTLDGMFVKSSSIARQIAIGALKMMGHINTTEVMEAKMEQEMKIDTILESLPESFSQFKMNYNMNKLKFTPVD
nr:uncharacterized protein LOC125420994 [Ziziphus jujuba var. spinosa]